MELLNILVFFIVASFLIVGAIMAVAAGLIGKTVAENLAQSLQNKAQPVERVAGRIVAKRHCVSGGGMEAAAFTSHYVTFEMHRGERREFPVSGQDYGLMVEGDEGVLWYQGTWFRGFQRAVPEPR